MYAARQPTVSNIFSVLVLMKSMLLIELLDRLDVRRKPDEFSEHLKLVSPVLMPYGCYRGSSGNQPPGAPYPIREDSATNLQEGLAFDTIDISVEKWKEILEFILALDTEYGM
jgi:hypothetical protein